MHRLALSIILLGLLAIFGCAGLSSVEIGGRNDRSTGTVYFLPTTFIPITVAVNEKFEQLVVRADLPIYVADQSQRFRLKANPSLVHVDGYTLKTNELGLLDSVDFKSEGRLDEIIVAAAKSAFLFQSAILPKTNENIVFEDRIDVGQLVATAQSSGPSVDLVHLEKSINDHISEYVNRYNAIAPKKSFLTNFKSATESYLTIAISRQLPGDGSTPAPDCTVGFCYRLPVPYTLTVHFANGTTRTTMFSVPNGSPTYAAAVPRGLFRTVQTVVDLNNGMLIRYGRTETGSELEALVTLPSNLVGAQLAALTQQGQILNGRAGVLEAKTKLLEAQANLQKAQTEDFTTQSAATAGKVLFEFVADNLVATTSNMPERQPRPANPPSSTSPPPPGNQPPPGGSRSE